MSHRGSCCSRCCTTLCANKKDFVRQLLQDNNNNDGGTTTSTCQCRPCCSYPNGVIPVVLAQILVLLGIATSFYTILDCKVVKAKSASVDPFLASLIMFPAVTANTTTSDPQMRSNVSSNYTYYSAADRKHTGMGLLVFEDMNGNCAFDAYSGEYDDDDENATPIMVNGKNKTTAFDAYFEFTNSFNVARAMIVSAAVLGVVSFLWLSLWSCLSQTKLARWIWAFGMFPIATLLQGLTLLVLRSEFCEQHECVFGQTLAYTIVGVVCYMTAGIIVFVWSKNYTDDSIVVVDRFARPAHLELELSSEFQHQHRHPDDMPCERRPNNNNERALSSSDVERHGSQTAVGVAEIVAPPMIDGVGDAQEVPIDPMLIQSILGSPDETKLATMQQEQQDASDDSSE